MRYQENKKAAITTNTDPTMTDQSAANDTDINVIVAKYQQHGQVIQGTKPPISGDFTQMPLTLAEAFAAAKNLRALEAQMPGELKGMTVNEFMALTPEQVIAKLKKEEAKPPPEEPK